MPFLPLEPYLHPEELFTDPGCGRKENGRWWALHTRPRAEKTLARRLLARNQAFFLPLYKREYRSAGRLLKSYLPLFPSYLFVHGDEQSRIHALETNLVVSTIFVDDQEGIEADLVRVMRLMASGYVLSPEERLLPGTLVEIIDGPLTGIQGKIMQHSGRTRVFVEIKFLQSAVSVEVENSTIAPVAVSTRSTAAQDE
jgi:transcriptional antiterminator RfaH